MAALIPLSDSVTAAAFHALSSVLLAMILVNAVDVGVVPSGWTCGALAVQGRGFFFGGGEQGMLSRQRLACNVIN
jgi:hypothetical protein